MITPRLMTLQDLFGDRILYRVPIYQRSYRWEQEDQWQPLWEDIQSMATARLDGRESVGHFLGAIVVELASAEPGRVKEYSVIDGQQRLTTLQVVLAALDSVVEKHDPDRSADVDRLLRNDGRHTENELSFKVWPSETDRDEFSATVRRPNGKAPDGKGGIAGAYRYFRGEIDAWLQAGGSADTLTERLDVLQDTLEGLLQVVAILLDGSSDAQVIFETLNSRGADLTALDLVKNSLLRAASLEPDTNVDQLHAAYWQPALGDAEYWLETVSQGRLWRARADLFLMHWLAMRTGKIVKAPRLFAEFRIRVMRADDAPPASALIEELCGDAQKYRSFDSLDPQSDAGRFFRRLDRMDTTTLIPVALLLFRSSELSPERRDRGLRALESWLVRRMILGATTQHYNRLLTALLADLHEQRDLTCADDVIIAALRAFESSSDVWPSDDAVATQLRNWPLYGWINQRRIGVLLEACELQIAQDDRTEQLPVPDGLTIEHALPRDWRDNWGLSQDGAVDLEAAEHERDGHVHRLGNLTLVTRRLNSTLSNAPWSKKRLELQKLSQLLINQRLCIEEDWDEAKIDHRGTILTDYILDTWPGPEASVWVPSVHPAAH